MLWPGLVRRFPVLEIRDFRLLLADRVLAPAAAAFSLVGVAVAVLDVTGSTADLSYVLAAQILPALVFALVGGVVADRIAPQKVIVAANLMIAVGEGGFGLLVLTGHPQLWQMIALETLNGAGMAVFYPASQALLPRLVPARLLQQASALSRLAMNAAQMGGAALAGVFVAVAGPGWALAACGIGMLGTVPLLLAIRAPGAERSEHASLLRDLREGWTEFASHTWLWVTTIQFCVVMAVWYGAFDVLGPAVARHIPADRLARVSSYDVLGTVAAMPAGALVAGPLAASIGVPVTEYGAAVLILVASLLALVPREVRSLRSDQAPGPEEAPGTEEAPGPELALAPGETPRSEGDSGQDAARVMAGS